MPSPRARRHRTQAGAVLPASALVLCICAVAIAAAAYLLIAPNGSQKAQPTSAKVPATAKKVTHPPSPTATVRPKPLHKKHHKHKAPATVDKGAVNVEVFNNSNVQGLAAQTSALAEQHGWRVVGSGNWFGTIVAPTVYYPPQFASAAKLLASDLHIERLRPAVPPMQFDRLTVILTSAY